MASKNGICDFLKPYAKVSGHGRVHLKKNPKGENLLNQYFLYLLVEHAAQYMYICWGRMWGHKEKILRRKSRLAEPYIFWWPKAFFLFLSSILVSLKYSSLSPAGVGSDFEQAFSRCSQLNHPIKTGQRISL